MTDRMPLADLCVRDVWDLLVKEPTTISPKASVEAVLEATVADTRTRHAYVVDETGALIGCVRMNALVEYLFPLETIVRPGGEVCLAGMADLQAATVEDLMDPDPRFVRRSTTLADVAKILMDEKINELPVVDESRRLLGQVNVYEIILAYLNLRSSGNAPGAP